MRFASNKSSIDRNSPSSQQIRVHDAHTCPGSNTFARIGGPQASVRYPKREIKIILNRISVLRSLTWHDILSCKPSPCVRFGWSSIERDINDRLTRLDWHN
jgi:hypothetical protein